MVNPILPLRCKMKFEWQDTFLRQIEASFLLPGFYDFWEWEGGASSKSRAALVQPANCAFSRVELTSEGFATMGLSDPETRKKLSDARWLEAKHAWETQSWPWWRRLVHGLSRCRICSQQKAKEQ
jgi:hypothetical protein